MTSEMTVGLHRITHPFAGKRTGWVILVYRSKGPQTGAIITTIGDALSVLSARLAIDEEIATNFDNIKSQQEQDARFAELESQMKELQQQLAEMSEQKKN